MIIDDIAIHSVADLSVADLARSIQSRLAIACPAETLATDAIAIAADSGIPLIIVTTDPARPPRRDQDFQRVAFPGNPERVVCGVVEPTYLRQALIAHFRQSSGPLLDMVREYEHDQNEARRHWRHEWLNRQAGILQFCGQGGGHLTILPCRYHSGNAQALSIWR